MEPVDPPKDPKEPIKSKINHSAKNSGVQNDSLRPEVSIYQENPARKEQIVRKESWAPAVKWIAICLTMLMVTLVLHKVYRVVTAPVRGLGSAVETMVGSAETIATRLDVELEKPKTFSQLSEEAFIILNKYPVRESKDWDQSLFWMTDLRGSNYQVCQFQVDFGEGPIWVHTAATNKDYATAKAVGSKQDRIIRAHIVTGGKAIGLRSYWDDDAGKWKMRWRRMTMGKALNDNGAQQTMHRVLQEIIKNCQVN